MQSTVVALLVLACLAAVLRGIWKQFTAKEGGGCGGCSSAKGCSQAQTTPCTTEKSAVPAESRVQWPPRSR